MVRIPTGLGAILALVVFVVALLMALGVVPFTAVSVAVLLGVLAVCRLV